MQSAPIFYVVPGSTVKRIIDENKQQVFDAVEEVVTGLAEEWVD